MVQGRGNRAQSSFPIPAHYVMPAKEAVKLINSVENHLYNYHNIVVSFYAEKDSERRILSDNLCSQWWHMPRCYISPSQESLVSYIKIIYGHAIGWKVLCTYNAKLINIDIENLVCTDHLFIENVSFYPLADCMAQGATAGIPPVSNKIVFI